MGIDYASDLNGCDWLHSGQSEVRSKRHSRDGVSHGLARLIFGYLIPRQCAGALEELSPSLLLLLKVPASRTA
jgi:hypothetical protein